MLAYIFWHRPRPGAERGEYEAALADFRAGLERSRPEGFRGCVTARIEGAPWAGPEGRGYEDWYLLEAGHALDSLNDAAVSGPCREPHARVAAMATGGAGGLMKLRSGRPGLEAPHSAWFTKPEGMSYPELDRLLQPWLDGPGCGLWRRQMVLGPALEFCLLSPEPVDLAGAGLELVRVARTPL